MRQLLRLYTRASIQLLPLNIALPRWLRPEEAQNFMQIHRGASHVYKGFWSNYNNNGSHNSVSPCDERMTVNELPRVGAGVFSSPSMCLCTHRETLQVGVHRCLPCRLHGIPETQASLLWARRDAAARSVVYRINRKSEGPLSRGATPLSGESTLSKHQCAMRKFFRF